MENKDKLVTAEGLKAVYDALKDGIPADITVTTTGDGNAITGISKSGSTITATKDSSFAASWHQHNPADLTNGLLNSNIYITAHPEDSQGSIYPFLNNDIAFLSTRGGSISAYTTTDTDYTAVSLTKATDYTTLSSVDLITDASPTYCVFRLSSQSDVLVVDLTLPDDMLFEYNSKFYIDFGGWQWSALSVSLYLWNSNSTNAEQTYRLINSGSGQYRAWYTQGEYTWYTDPAKSTVGGYAFNKIRFVLTNWASTQGYRIAQIGVLNYNSTAQRATTMSRGIDDAIYRSITPASTNTYTLGSTSNQWSGVYANTMQANTITLQSSGGTNYDMTIDNNGKLLVGGNAVATDYTLPVATTSTLGGIKLGVGLTNNDSDETCVKFKTQGYIFKATDWKTTTSAAFCCTHIIEQIPDDQLELYSSKGVSNLLTFFITYSLIAPSTTYPASCAAQYAAIAQAQLVGQMSLLTTTDGTYLNLVVNGYGAQPTIPIQIQVTYTDPHFT